MKKAIAIILLLAAVFFGLSSCEGGTYINPGVYELEGGAGGGLGGGAGSGAIPSVKKFTKSDLSNLSITGSYPSTQEKVRSMYDAAMRDLSYVDEKIMDQGESSDVYKSEYVSARAAKAETFDVTFDSKDYDYISTYITDLKGRIWGSYSETKMDMNWDYSFTYIATRLKAMIATKGKMLMTSSGTSANIDMKAAYSYAVAYTDGSDAVKYVVNYGFAAKVSIDGGTTGSPRYYGTIECYDSDNNYKAKFDLTEDELTYMMF